jgi:hypothetical protein
MSALHAFLESLTIAATGPYALGGYAVAGFVTIYYFYSRYGIKRIELMLKGEKSEANRLAIITKEYGPQPAKMTAEQWLANRKFTLVLVLIGGIVLAITIVVIVALIRPAVDQMPTTNDGPPVVPTDPVKTKPTEKQPSKPDEMTASKAEENASEDMITVKLQSQAPQNIAASGFPTVKFLIINHGKELCVLEALILTVDRESNLTFPNESGLVKTAAQLIVPLTDDRQKGPSEFQLRDAIQFEPRKPVSIDVLFCGGYGDNVPRSSSQPRSINEIRREQGDIHLKPLIGTFVGRLDFKFHGLTSGSTIVQTDFVKIRLGNDR